MTALTVLEVVDLIAERVRDPSDSVRQARDKVRKRLLYAAETGDLAGGKSGGFDPRAVVAWARTIKAWAGKLDDLPSLVAATLGDQLVASDMAEATVSSNNLERCQQLLAEAEAEISRLRAELARANAENDALRPGAARYEGIRSKNRAAAQKPRKRR